MNILSLKLGSFVSGKEINDWCIDQIDNHGSHEKEARRLINKHYDNDRIYEAIRTEENSGINAKNILCFRFERELNENNSSEMYDINIRL